jgi:hypothetical protein
MIKEASGDTSWVATAEDFDRWLDQYAGDIVVGPPAYHRVVRLAELDGLDPAGAAALRTLFRRQWASDEWFPSRSSVLAAALRDGLPITYVGPCPYCLAKQITATLRDSRLKCPSCGAHLAGAAPPAAEKC